jgi:transcriptional regulator with XRE-family HTH domain
MLVGVSQEQLGAAIGVTFQQVQKYEKGTNRVSSGRLQRIAHALRVPLDYFYQGVPETGPAGSVAETQRAADVMRFLATGESVELMKAFVEIANKRIRREFLQLVRALAGQQGGPAEAKAISTSADDVRRSPVDQHGSDRTDLFEEAERALLEATPPASENVRLAMRKIQHFLWEPQDAMQQQTREALMHACRDYLQPKSADKRASIAAVKKAWDAFARAWGYEAGERKAARRPAAHEPITAEEWAL